MQDNTLARTLCRGGDDAVLVPTYTPIRVDEEDVSVDRVFLGGINVYLDSTVPGWKRMPAWMTSWLNRPGLIRWLSRFGRTDAAHLGSLTLDMLRGSAGPQRREIRQFVSYLCDELQPDLILFSNALLSGVLSELRQRFDGRILCLLQGDDVFLEALNPNWKQKVLNQLRDNCRLFDGFLTHSRYYRDFMAKYLDVADDRFRQIPLTIDIADTSGGPHAAARVATPGQAGRRVRVGYFARICPEKGIQNLLGAAAQVLPDCPNAEIAIAGYLSEQHRRWFEQLLAEATAAAPNRIHWLGSPADRVQKFDIMSRFDFLCVPTEYHEPKGLYVLEAGLLGIPALLPSHGAFPELIEALGDGWLYDGNTGHDLASALRRCLLNLQPRPHDLSRRVIDTFGMDATTAALQQAIRDF